VQVSSESVSSRFRGVLDADIHLPRHDKRVVMRAWSAKQRFPVAQWVKQLDDLYGQSIRIHHKEAKKRKLEVVSNGISPSRPASRNSVVSYLEHGPVTILSPSSDSGRASPVPPSRMGTPTLRELASPGLTTPLAPWANGSRSNSPRASVASSIGGSQFYSNSAARDSTVSVDSFAMRAQNGGMASPAFPPEGGLGFPRPAFMQHRNSSLLSLPDVVGDRSDLKLQKVDQFFNDTNGEYYAEFDEMLDDLSAGNSTSDLCIETFLKRSEKEWFSRYRDAKLGRLRDSSRTRSVAASRPASRNGDGRNESVASRGRQRHRSTTPSGLARSVFEMSPPPGDPDDEFLLGDGYQAPTGLKKCVVLLCNSPTCSVSLTSLTDCFPSALATGPSTPSSLPSAR